MDENQKEEIEPKNERQPSFPIVAIGASAGGMEAVTDLLQHLSPDTGMAYVYIQHLDTQYESALVPILQRATEMKVLEVENLMPIQPDHLFVIPPNADMTIEEGFFNLSLRQPSPVRHAPIDEFFVSLSKKAKEGIIGIILSGMASDGTIGLKAIKQSGGLTYAQDGSAMFQSMPKSAIAADAVDRVLSTAEIAVELTELSKNGNLLSAILQPDEKHDSEQDEPGNDYNHFSARDIKTLLSLLREAVGVDFMHYKINTISRRIAKRMLLHKMETISDYVAYCKLNPKELDILYRDLLINVTQFFRDKEATDYLHQKLLPSIMESKGDKNSVRIWIPACSTGEEAYSMAIMVAEIADTQNFKGLIQIFATDLSEIAITKARIGVYSIADADGISEERLNRFFVKTDGHYQIIKRIRDLCIFAPHNILKDPPFSKVNLISCCNLLIYLDVSLQKKLFANFHYSLNKNGYLVVGKSETVGNSSHLFTLVSKKLKIFLKKNDVAPAAIFDFDVSQRDKETLRSKAAVTPTFHSIKESENLDRIIDNILLTQYVPSGVVITHDFDILLFRGSTGLFLEPLPGKASLNLLKMARPGLETELRNAVNRAIKSAEPVRVSGINITHKGNIHHTAFEAIPLILHTHQDLLLVVFEEMKTPSPAELKVNFSKDRRVKQLETEMTALREDLRSIVEEYETANEELQSANEEIVSSNEELQSINEELETSKEELESSNEELMTINQELNIRNEQLVEAYEYTDHVVATIREAVIILDTNLRVRAANEAFYQTFKTNDEQTQGVLIYEINNGQWNLTAIRRLFEITLPTMKQVYGFELRHEFEGIGEKILMLNVKMVTRQSDGTQFILLAIEDITEHRQAEQLLREREAWLRTMADNVPVMIWLAGPDKNFTYLNKTWLSFTGRSLETETEIGWTEGVCKDDLGLVLSTYHKSFGEKKPFSIEYRMRRHDGQFRWVLNNGVPQYDASGVFTGYAGSCTEINDQRINAELERQVKERTMELLQANLHLEQSNKELAQFAYIASHDLQEPLRKIITFSNRLTERYKESIPEDAVDLLRKINFSSERMRALIDALLNFSRISQFDNHYPLTDLNLVLKEIVSDYELLIQEKNAVLQIAALPVIPAVPLQMNQLFHNLLSNALKFSSPNPVIIIDCRILPTEEVQKFSKLDSSLEYCEISFADNGIGFSEEFAEQIFGMFQQLTVQGYVPGTGIGLALCRKIVQNHGGEIYARSNEGKRTVFYIILPVHQRNN